MNCLREVILQQHGSKSALSPDYDTSTQRIPVTHYNKDAYQGNIRLRSSIILKDCEGSDRYKVIVYYVLLIMKEAHKIVKCSQEVVFSFYK